MPDERSAATEHRLLQEITAPLATLHDDPMPVAADVEFPIVRRGYDRLAVDAYVRKTSQLVAELQATQSPDAAVRRALERVGEQISGILKRAHETAEQLTAGARHEAEDRLEEARREAAQIIATAYNRVKELDTDTDRIWAERQRIVDDARELAAELQALADSAADRFPGVEEPEIGRHESPFGAQELEADEELEDEEEFEDEDVENPRLGREPFENTGLRRPGLEHSGLAESEGPDAEDPDATDPTDPMSRQHPGTGAEPSTPGPAIDGPDPEATAVLRPLREEPERRGW